MNDFNEFFLEFSWILARTKPLSAETTATIADLIAANGINGDKYVAHDLPECSKQP